MHYAQTLAATHEREFLRFHKITADAAQLAVDPRDLYDLLESRSARRPGVAERLLHAPSSAGLRTRQRVLDLRQVRH